MKTYRIRVREGVQGELVEIEVDAGKPRVAVSKGMKALFARPTQAGHYPPWGTDKTLKVGETVTIACTRITSMTAEGDKEKEER